MLREHSKKYDNDNRTLGSIKRKLSFPNRSCILPGHPRFLEHVCCAKQLRYRTTEQMDVWDDAEMKYLVDDAFDAPPNDTKSAENPVAPMISPHDQRVIVQPRHSAVRDYKLVATPTLSSPGNTPLQHLYC